MHPRKWVDTSARAGSPMVATFIQWRRLVWRRLAPRRRSRHEARRPRRCNEAHRKSAVGLVSEKSRRRPTLPGGLPPSTIGAGGLNCRVRNGNGCFPAAMATGNCALGRAALSVLERARACLPPSPRPISTGQLNALPHVHFRPINVVVWPRALPG